MKRLLLEGMATLCLTVGAALAGPFEDGYAAYQRGDYSGAVTSYRVAATQGTPEAAYNLGLMYYNGRGVQKDFVEAFKWYRMAAEEGYPSAQVVLGVMYFASDHRRTCGGHGTRVGPVARNIPNRCGKINASRTSHFMADACGCGGLPDGLRDGHALYDVIDASSISTLAFCAIRDLCFSEMTLCQEATCLPCGSRQSKNNRKW